MDFPAVKGMHSGCCVTFVHMNITSGKCHTLLLISSDFSDIASFKLWSFNK